MFVNLGTLYYKRRYMHAENPNELNFEINVSSILFITLYEYLRIMKALLFTCIHSSLRMVDVYIYVLIQQEP